MSCDTVPEVVANRIEPAVMLEIASDVEVAPVEVRRPSVERPVTVSDGEERAPVVLMVVVPVCPAAK